MSACTIIESLKKSYDNCKKGNWDNIPQEDIDRMIKYQQEQYLINEEFLSFDESKKIEDLFNKLLKECKKRNVQTDITGLFDFK